MRKFTTAGLEYIDNTTASNVAYTYYVASVDAAGNVCIPAGPWLWVRRSRVDIDAQAPDTPKDLKASAPDYKRVNLNWTASTDNVGVVKYLILRNGKQIAENASTSWSDTAVIGSTTYAYAVKAVDAANNTSAASAVVSVTTPTSPDAMPPTTPTNLIATAAGVTQVNLTWLASTDNVGVAKYEIYRDGSILNQTPSNTINYTDTSVMGNTSYSYQVKAVDAAGNKSGFSITITVKTPIPKDIQAPTAPTNLVGSTLTVSQVKLTWNASTDNIAVTKYRIYRVASPAYIAEVTTTSYDDNTVQADTSYSYTVKALDAENNMSFDSNVLTIKTGKVVNPPVVITKDVKNVTAMEGGIATFWAEATGVEPFTYKWYFENNSATDFIQICQGKKICTLNPVRPEHAGKYNVRITSPDGQSNAGAAGYLTVTPLATNPGISCDYQTVKTALATAVDGATILLKAETCDWKDFPALKRS
jgi:chitodextrinase